MHSASPGFLGISRGDLVIVQDHEATFCEQGWWMGEVIHIIQGARGVEPSLFQISCIDTGVIRIVNADIVLGPINQSDKSPKSTITK